MQYLPIFVDLHQKNVLVVGGGQVALRKIQLLLQAGACIKIVAHQLVPVLMQYWQAGKLAWVAQQFDITHLDNIDLVISATDDGILNQQVFEQAQARHLWVNTVDKQSQCSFIFPSIIDRSPVQIAISSAGTAPVLVRLLREKLEMLLPQHLSIMAEIAGKWRNKVREKLSTIRQRRYFWETLFEHNTFQHLSEHQHIERAEAFLAQQLIEIQSQYFTTKEIGIQRGTVISTNKKPVGEVTLVGAGPGDAGLLTIKGLQAIQRADVILYDALVSREVLALARRDADKVLVGKRAQQTSISQMQINQLLIQHARQGKRVVRLKGGDAFVFGRGGEELQALKAADIPFSVVPGITAAIGVTAYAGIPLTHRSYAQNVTFITGHLSANGKPIDWRTLAVAHTTLVIYMGTLKVDTIQTQLLACGRVADTPVAVISQGTLTQQKIYTGTLQQLATLATGIEKPALLVIGEVVALQQDLHWFGKKATHLSATCLVDTLPTKKAA